MSDAKQQAEPVGDGENALGRDRFAGRQAHILLSDGQAEADDFVFGEYCRSGVTTHLKEVQTS